MRPKFTLPFTLKVALPCVSPTCPAAPPIKFKLPTTLTTVFDGMFKIAFCSTVRLQTVYVPALNAFDFVMSRLL